VCSCLQLHALPEDLLLYLGGREEDAGRRLSGEAGTLLGFQVPQGAEGRGRQKEKICLHLEAFLNVVSTGSIS